MTVPAGQLKGVLGVREVKLVTRTGPLAIIDEPLAS
jgi:hypothetical protein